MKALTLKTINKLCGSLSRKTIASARLLRTKTLTWSTLHQLYSGMIGKSIFLIGLVVPAAKLSGIGVHFDNYDYYLIGAILISIGFISEKMFLPYLILAHTEPSHYTNSLVQRVKSNYFDGRFEFRKVDEYPDKEELVALAEFTDAFKHHFPSENARKVLGDEKFSYYYGLLNYLVIDRTKPFARFVCTGLFLFGVCYLYFPIVKSTIAYFRG